MSSSPSVLFANLRLTLEVERLRSLLQDQGIPILLLKGISFLDTLYPDLGQRPMVDADILIRSAHGAKADLALRAAGYLVTFVATRPISSQFSHERRYVHRDCGIHLDLHTALTNPGMIQINMDDIWSRYVTYDLPQRKIPTLCPEDSLLHVLLHRSRHLGMGDATMIGDISRIVSKWCPRWDIVASRAREWQISALVHLGLIRAARQGIPVPLWVREALQPRWPRAFLLRRLFDLEGMGQARLHHRLAQLATLVLTTEDPARDLRFLARYSALRVRDRLASGSWRTS